MAKEEHKSPEKRQNNIDNLRWLIIMEYQKIANLLQKTPNQPSNMKLITLIAKLNLKL